MGIDKVFIVGAGLMGSGIAQVCAQSGIQVILKDISNEAIEKGFKSIAWSVGKFIEKGKLTEEKEAILGRIKTTTEWSQANEADLAIEAVFEKLDLKQEIFRQVDRSCKSDAVLATNTSAIPITELATVTERPENVVGLHFFSPVPMMQAGRAVAMAEAAVPPPIA